MVRGEEKQFEATIEHLIEYTKNIKISLLMLINAIETDGDNIGWPQVLDSFTSICGQINTLMRFTRENKSQFIENRVVLPLMLSPDKDEELARFTEGRVHVVNHEMVPDYLRTKPDPEIEEFEKNLQQKAKSISPDAAVKQVEAMNKLVSKVTSLISSNRARADIEMSRQPKPSYSQNDTSELLMAVSTGKGLRMNTGVHRGPHLGPNDPSMNQHKIMEANIQKQNAKAPELKTNIKAGP